MKRLNVDVDNLVRLYEGGLSENALAKKLGLCRTVVRRRLIEASASIRGPSEAATLKWSVMSKKKRQAQVKAAHDAVRGREHSIEEKEQRAKTVMRKQLHMSPFEPALSAELLKRGIRTIPQLAIGPYNCDLGASPVAVEVFGGEWHWSGRHMRRTPERFRYILNAGWHIFVVKATRGVSPSQAADYVVAFLQEIRGDPSARRQYRVVGRGGETLASGSSDDDEISIKPPFTSGRDRATGQYKRVPM